ncbi:alpha/beta hydrolase [Paenibacillus sp. MMS18-CY102]|uniref:alpha/beta hydrolase n=1 Tax=Paenibacillus sp. MMS18-CY102 TaxID=2682849 RepID=UPI00136548C2|nr:hypothetical protein [Paenibacillus sp. MMS18-CY102]MWC30456.1 hypothetical protein [Paenibacillus sp. MMS18-CY102]
MNHPLIQQPRQLRPANANVMNGIAIRKSGKWIRLFAVVFGAAAVTLLFFIRPVARIQQSSELPILWPVACLTLLLCATWGVLLFKVYAKQRLATMVGLIMITLALGYGAMVSAVYLIQDRMLYMSPALSERAETFVASHFPNREQLIVEPNGHVQLQGWFINQSAAESAPLLIYYGGNNENVPLSFFGQLEGWNIAYANYRGYGRSEGKPDEGNLKADALTTFDTLVQREDVDPSHVVILGRSLGSGVAAYVASQRAAAGVVLISPYDTYENVLQDLFPLFPPFLMHNHYRSAELAPKITTPVLTLIGDRDKTISPARSHALMQQWGGEKQTVIVKGANHNSIVNYSIVPSEIQRFLVQFQQ